MENHDLDVFYRNIPGSLSLPRLANFVPDVFGLLLGKLRRASVHVVTANAEGVVLLRFIKSVVWAAGMRTCKTGKEKDAAKEKSEHGYLGLKIR